MPRKLIVAALAAGLSIAVAIVLATPALAKGPSQARITGPGLTHAIVVSGEGEPGTTGTLATLATQTGLFTVMFGAGVSGSAATPALPSIPPPGGSLGPRFTILYTVPGVMPPPGQPFGQIRQDLYPHAAGGPVIYTPPGQLGFAGPLQVTGWLRASTQLTRTLAQLEISPRPAPAHPVAHPAARPAAHRASSPDLAWVIAPAVAIVAAALAGFVLRQRRRVTNLRPDH